MRYQDHYIFRLASMDALNTITDILFETASWIKSKGSQQWSKWLDPKPWLIDWLKDGLRSGEFYLIYDANDPSRLMGMVRLLWSDELYWGKQSIDSGYVHSIALKRYPENRGKGTLILDWACDMTMDKGFDKIRLDCVSTSQWHQDFYKSYGFKKVGSSQIEEESFVLFEMNLPKSTD